MIFVCIPVYPYIRKCDRHCKMLVHWCTCIFGSVELNQLIQTFSRKNQIKFGVADIN